MSSTSLIRTALHWFCPQPLSSTITTLVISHCFSFPIIVQKLSSYWHRTLLEHQIRCALFLWLIVFFFPTRHSNYGCRYVQLFKLKLSVVCFSVLLFSHWLFVASFSILIHFIIAISFGKVCHLFYFILFVLCLTGNMNEIHEFLLFEADSAQMFVNGMWYEYIHQTVWVWTQFSYAPNHSRHVRNIQKMDEMRMQTSKSNLFKVFSYIVRKHTFPTPF